MSLHRYSLSKGYGWKAIIQISPTKQISKRFKRRVDAANWELEQKTKLLTDGPTPKFETNYKLSDLISIWMNEYAEVHLAPGSIHRHQQCIKNQIIPYLGGKCITDLNHKLIENWIHLLRRKSGLKPKTCNMILGLLKSILNFGVRQELINSNPVAKVRSFRVDPVDFSFWMPNEINAVLDFCSETHPDIYYPLSIALLTGMRRGEIQALKWDCIDLKNRLITIKRNYCDKSKKFRDITKGRNIRRIPINHQLFQILMELKGFGNCQLVIKKFNYRDASLKLRNVAQEVGVKPIRFHDTRHTFASNFMMHGGSIFDLQKILGHHSITQTERYSHLAPNYLTGKTDILDYGKIKKNDNVINLF